MIFLRKYTRPGDLLIIASVLIIGFSPIWLRNTENAEKYSVMLDGKEIYSLPSNRDTLVSVEARHGRVLISVENGRASIVESDCPKGICIHTGKIERSGQTIACVPNKLIIIGIGKMSRGKYDAILK